MAKIATCKHWDDVEFFINTRRDLTKPFMTFVSPVGAGCAHTDRVAGVKRPEELFAWQRCRQLSNVIFEITESGPAARNREFQQQIRDAAQSAAPLIAEGFVRYLPGDFARYLRMARAEIAEVQTDLDEARDHKYFSEEQQTRASIVARRAMYLTTRLLTSKLRQIENERNRKKRRRRTK